MLFYPLSLYGGKPERNGAAERGEAALRSAMEAARGARLVVVGLRLLVLDHVEVFVLAQVLHDAGWAIAVLQTVFGQKWYP